MPLSVTRWEGRKRRSKSEDLPLQMPDLRQLIAAFGTKSTGKMKAALPFFSVSVFPLQHLDVIFKHVIYMRTFTLLLSALLISSVAMAQTAATFDTLTLATPNSYYTNYSAPGTDVGFNDGLAHFPCYYDTAWGGMWSCGFAYSNMTDSTTSGFMNQYSAKAAIGQGGSNNYVAVNCIDPTTFSPMVASTKLFLIGAAVGKKVRGFYITNSTYAYNSMRDGDGFGKKFGGVTGTDPDWFKLTVKGYSGGALTADSVNFYLADFRFAGTTNDYIIKAWTWVDLLPLGNVDSLHFLLTSSDTNSQGIKTPAYFAMDGFTTQEVETPPVNSVANVNATMAKVYPNPASDKLMIDLFDNSVKMASIIDAAGRMITTVDCTAHTEMNIADLAAGTYFLQLTGGDGAVTTKFQKR